MKHRPSRPVKLGTSRKKCRRGMTTALFMEPLAEDQENAAQDGELPDKLALQLFAIDGQFLRAAQRVRGISSV